MQILLWVNVIALTFIVACKVGAIFYEAFTEVVEEEKDEFHR